LRRLPLRSLIIGASGGLGSAILRELAPHSSLLVGTTRGHNSVRVRPGLDEGCVSRWLIGDLTDPNFRDEIVQTIRVDRIGLVINAAGKPMFGGLTTTSDHDMRLLIETNLTSPMSLIHSICKPKSGIAKLDYVQIGSALSHIGYPGYGPYCASKFGMNGFLESVSREISHSGICLRIFHPRATNTKFNSNAANLANQLTGQAIDDTVEVAKEFVQFLRTNRMRHQVGAPQRLFRIINAIAPKLIDRAIQPQFQKIKHLL
jgi:short-subunit dehydrogenase